jgi:hypothetical protein
MATACPTAATTAPPSRTPTSADINNDGIVNSIDLSIVRRDFGTNAHAGDQNGDGVVNALDLSAVRRLFSTRPGPSAWQTGSR